MAGRALLTRLGLGLGLATTAAAGAAVAAYVAADRRWTRADGPDGGRTLALRDGVDSTCTTPDGAELAVRVIGTGTRDVVLSHCWMGDRRYWSPVVDLLADDDVRIVVYDQRGHGASTVGSAGLTLEALADDLRAVLEHVDARDAVIAGHSMGGMTIQAFAGHHPEVLAERAAGLVLAGTACDGLGKPPAVERGLVFFVGHRLVEPVYRRRLGAALLLRGTIGRTVARSQLDALAETLLATPPHVRLDLMRAMGAMDLADGLGTVAVPTVVLTGSRDTLTPVARGERIAAVVPGATFELLPGMGHMLPWEAPDRIAAAIRTSLAPAPPAAPATPADTSLPV